MKKKDKFLKGVSFYLNALPNKFFCFCANDMYWIKSVDDKVLHAHNVQVYDKFFTAEPKRFGFLKLVKVYFRDLTFMDNG